MSEDKMRNDFERWFSFNKEKNKFEADLSKTNNQYNYTRTLNLWEGWKASRESLEVEFPEEMTPEYEGDGYKSRYDAAYCEGYNKALSDVESNAESQGIKVITK